MNHLQVNPAHFLIPHKNGCIFAHQRNSQIMYHFKAQNTAVILMGSNIGDKVGFMQLAIEALTNAGIAVVQKSSYYASDAWGFESDTFVNQAIICNTVLTPHQLLTVLQNVEKQAGRTSKTQTEYAARTLDLDIIFFNYQIIDNEDLTIPHPQVQNRNFALLPLKEIIPNYKHIVLQKTIATLAKECPDKGKVTKIPITVE